MITRGKWSKSYCFQVGLDDYDGCEIPLERMDDFEPEETYIIPNPVLAEKGEEETGDSVVDNQLDDLCIGHLTINLIIRLDIHKEEQGTVVH